MEKKTKTKIIKYNSRIFDMSTLINKGFTMSKSMKHILKNPNGRIDKIHCYNGPILPTKSFKTSNRHTFSKEKRFRYNYIIKDFN